MFQICKEWGAKPQGRGFQMQFDNGMVVSVQFGRDNYCSNRGREVTENDYGVSCENAEVAVWNVNEEHCPWVTRAVWKQLFDENLNDDVAGHVETAQVAAVLSFCCLNLLTESSNPPKEEWA